MGTRKTHARILVGDIGGTFTRLGVFQLDGGKPEMMFHETYPSQAQSSLEGAIEVFIERHGKTFSYGGFGVAGPVLANRAQVTNLPWVVDAQSLIERFGLSDAWVINDVEALAWGVSLLQPSDLSVLQAGDLGASGNAAVIAAGTGLGAAGLYWDRSQHHPFATEVGHADFAPRNDDEIELLQYLRARHGHVSYERVLSGPGLQTIYEYVCQHDHAAPPAQILAAMQRGSGAMAITSAALHQNDPASVKATNLFISIYGAAAGNLALELLALGGVYLGGGIAPKILAFLHSHLFLDAFLDKGRMRPLLGRIPVRVVMNERAGLIGVAACVANRMPS